jgi:anti-sigma B factor antagonist
LKVAVFFCSDCGTQVFARQAATIEAARCLHCARGEISVAHLADAVVVRVTGELDLARVDRFREALEGAVEMELPVRIDLAECTFIDSSGIHAILNGIERQNGTGGISVTAASPAVRRVLDLVGLGEILGSAAGRLAAAENGGGRGL